MQSIIVDKNEAGQRFDKYLKRYFKNAEPSLLYKMLRKKNIVLNKSKASGNEILYAGDEINTFFSDETFQKFSGKNTDGTLAGLIDTKFYLDAFNALDNIEIIYEDNDFVFMSKPVGVVSQTDENNKYSINEWLIGYLINKGETPDFNSFKPSCSNRIDRNTSGLIMAAKSYSGSRYLSDCIRNHKLQKYYLALVHGKVSGNSILKGYLVKDHKNNKVKILNSGKDNDYIHTVYETLASSEEYSLLKVKLVTGKSHQIRAHLSSVGHPLIGDIKYGGDIICIDNIEYNYQLLHAAKVVFPSEPDSDIALNGKEIICPPPSIYTYFWNVDIKM